MNKRKQKRILIFTIGLLVLSIGFAALAAQLKIDGTINVSKNSWDVHFENVDITPGSVTASTAPVTDDVNKNTTEITYAISFDTPGQFYEFTVDMVNAGTIDAMIDTLVNDLFEVDGETTKTLPSYLESSIKYNDGIDIAQYHKLAANTSEKIKVRVAFRTDINPGDLPSTSGESMKFILKADFKQADEHATDRPLPLITIPEGKTATTLSVGDEICINGSTTECFNFIKYDGTNNEDVVMLSKYNLNVGNNPKGTATNKQDSDLKGYVDSGTTYGQVAFSAGYYWVDSFTYTLKPEYGSSYPADVYDPVNYKTEPDFSTTCNNSTNCFQTSGYSIAYYVEAYKTILTGYGAAIKDARLLKYSEATDSSIGCNGSNNSCPTTGFITNTSFWLGSAFNDGYVWIVASDGYFGGNYFYDDYSFGVRPVIVISKSDL